MRADAGRQIGNGAAGDAGRHHELFEDRRRRTQCSITRTAISPAAGSAQSAASVRQAMATVAAASSVNTASAAGS